MIETCSLFMYTGSNPIFTNQSLFLNMPDISLKAVDKNWFLLTAGKFKAPKKSK